MALMSKEMAEKTNKLRIGVMISGGGTTVLNLLDEIDAGRLDGEIVVAIASRPCEGIDRLAKRGLDVTVISSKGLGDTERYSSAIAARLDSAGVDLVCLAGFLSFWQIPPRYEGKVMNIHPALLPAFGGTGMYGHFVHEAVLAAGSKVSGCTVHFGTNEYDAGPIIVQREVPVLPGDDAKTLASRVFTAEQEAYPEAIRLFAEGRLEIRENAVHILDRP